MEQVQNKEDQMIISSWEIECPICGEMLLGDTEVMNMEIECPMCSSMLEVSTEITWDTDVQVLEEKHEDCDEEE